MGNKSRFTSLKAKIMISTIIPVVVSFILISVVTLIFLFRTVQDAAQAEFMQINQKHANNFESKIQNAVDYLAILSSDLENKAGMATADRESLQQEIFKIFDDYGLLDGSSVYFEKDMFDGKDDYYQTFENDDDVRYGTETSGKICWYYYKDEGKTAYLPEAMENDIEFELPHYTIARDLDKPICTDPDPEGYEIDGKRIAMFTITYPIHNKAGNFIGAVTVDLFLEDIYEQLQNEEIYDTGYIVITNENGKVIYSPHYEDIGRNREEAGLDYQRPAAGTQSDFFNVNSILNGKKSLAKVNSTYIDRLDTSFYILIAAPLSEINASGIRLMIILIVAVIIFVAAIAVLLNFLIGKISAPLNEITRNMDKIAGGEYGARIEGEYQGEFAVVKNSVNKMADSIETFIKDSKKSLELLKNILNGLDAVIYVTKPDTGEILFINDKMKRIFNIQGNGVGQICYKALQENMDHKCDFCPCHQLDKDPTMTVVWEENSSLTKRTFRNTDTYIEWLEGGKAHLQHSVDITDMKQAQFTLDRRLKQQAVMASISQSFLSGADINTLIKNALRQTGEFIGVSQILYYKLEDDGKTFVCENEWISSSANKQSCIGIKQIVPDSLLNNMKSLSGATLTCLDSNNPELKEVMNPYMVNFENYITVPIFVKGELYGALDLYKESTFDVWSESDNNFAMLISSLLSGVFERESMEGQLRRLSSIVESSPQFIMYITAEGLIDYVNPAAVTISGYSGQELIDGGLNIIFDEKTVEAIKEEYIPATFKDGSCDFEINLTDASGRIRIMAFSSFTTGPESTNVGCIASDVTEVRKLENEIIAAKELAEQGSRSKSEFLARMSHEMRTPMNAVIGMTTIAKNTVDPEKKEHCLDRIDNASRHLLGVINDILDMSKIEANKFELSYSEFNFEKMIQRVFDVINFKIDERRQKFSINIDPVIPPALIGDEQRLAQVITNLLSNAIKFTEDEGSISLTVKKISEENGTVVLQTEIEDSGMGISPEQQAKLFHSFEQADGSISRKFGGTGLGLVISKRIIEMMGGRIWVESEVGKGSKFSFIIVVGIGVSVKNEPAPAIAEKEAPQEPSFKGKHILLAEDVEVNREIVLTLLEDTGVEIDCAENGIEAVEKFAANPDKYDLIFMDIHMPLMNGFEATVKIRSMDLPQAKTVPIVAMTANVFKEDVDKCLASGMNDHTGKPIEISDIEAKMKKYML